MPIRDVVYLIIKPFLGKRNGATEAKHLRPVEQARTKSRSAITQVMMTLNT